MVRRPGPRLLAAFLVAGGLGSAVVLWEPAPGGPGPRISVRGPFDPRKPGLPAPPARPPVPPAPAVPGPPLASAPPASPFGPLVWPPGDGPLPGTLDRLRTEIGEPVSPQDFAGSGPQGRVDLTQTPDGSSLDLRVFWSYQEWKWAALVQNQTSGGGYYPGVDLELFEYPLKVARNSFLVTPRMALWTEPEGSWGALGALTVEFALRPSFWVWVEAKVKTPGWEANDPGTDPAGGFRAGFHWTP